MILDIDKQPLSEINPNKGGGEGVEKIYDGNDGTKWYSNNSTLPALDTATKNSFDQNEQIKRSFFIVLDEKP